MELDTNIQIDSPTLLEWAKVYRQLGLSSIGCKNKVPVGGSWKQYQKRIPTVEEQPGLLKGAEQIAIICGSVSGYVEVIDVDCKNDPQGMALFDSLWGEIVDYYKSSPPPFAVESTPSGGMHISYRNEGPIDGNTKLAHRNQNGKRLCTIETRGEGGYFVCAPSPRYKLLLGSFENLPTISSTERADILDICRSFSDPEVTHLQEERKEKTPNVDYRQLPGDAYNADLNHPILEVLSNAGWTLARDDGSQAYLKRLGSTNRWGATYHYQKRILYVFSSSAELAGDQAYSPFKAYTFLVHKGSFREAAKDLRSKGYGIPFTEIEKSAITRAADCYRNGFDLDLIQKILKDDYNLFEASEISPILETAKTLSETFPHVFWVSDKKGVIKIDRLLLLRFVRSQGFFLLGPKNDDKKAVIQVVSEARLIRRIADDTLRKYVEQWVCENLDTALADNVVRALLSFPAEGWKNITKHLPDIDKIKVLRDTRDESFIPFKNGIVTITKECVRLMNYNELPEGVFIWEREICPSSFPDEELPMEIAERTDAYIFIKRIAGISPDLDALSLDELQNKHPERFRALTAFFWGIGYFLSTFKDPNLPLCPIFEEENTDSAEGGGTGKGILMKMIGFIRSTIIIPCRTWNPDKNFAFQRIHDRVRNVILDDAPQNFPLEKVYNLGTEGVEVEEKHKGAVFIDYEDSCKWGITTNYSLLTKGNHGDRRFVKIPLSRYFSKSHKPIDEFGHLLFLDWSPDEWVGFYQVMCNCIKFYLSSPVPVTIPMSNDRLIKRVRQQYNDDFFEWGQKMISGNGWKLLTSSVQGYVPLRSLFEHYESETNDKKTFQSNSAFGRAVAEFCKSFAIHVDRETISAGMLKGSTEVRFRVEDASSTASSTESTNHLGGDVSGDDLLPF